MSCKINRKQAFVLLEVLVLALVSLWGLRFFALPDAARLAVGLLAAYLPARVLLARDHSAGVAARCWLLLTWAILGVMIALSIDRCTGGDSAMMLHPRLMSDDRGYFDWALSQLDPSVHRPHVTFVGYPLIISLIWRVLGVHIVWPLVFNAMCVLLACVFTGKMTVTLVAPRDAKSSRWVMAAALMMCSMLFFMLAHALKVLKDPACCVATTAVGLALARFVAADTKSRAAWVKCLLLMTSGCLLMALVRTSYVYFFMLGVGLMTVAKWRARWRRGLALLAVAVAAYAVGFCVSFYPFSQQVSTISGGYPMQRIFITGYAQQPYLEMIGQYCDYPVWKRLLLLPVTAGVQFIIPFPWIYNTSADGALLELFPRLRFMWYFVGGLVLFYYLFMSWRRGAGGLGVWALWPALVFLIIAYVVGGSVSRYMLPFEFMFIPMAVFVLYKVRNGEYRNAFVVWMIFYCLVLVSTLIICHEVQLEYLREMSRYYREHARHRLTP